jgi:hypothetical protein
MSENYNITREFINQVIDYTYKTGDIYQLSFLSNQVNIKAYDYYATRQYTLSDEYDKYRVLISEVLSYFRQLKYGEGGGPNLDT